MKKRLDSPNWLGRGAVILAIAALAVLIGADRTRVIADTNGTGTLDSSFGTGGIVTTNLGGGQNAYAAALQADGKIVVGGRVTVSTTPPNFNFALVRYNTNGSLDAGFGSGGKVITEFAGSNDQINAVTIQADGKILAVGSAFSGGSGTDFGVARYDTNGNLDPSFGTGGKLTTFISASDDAAYGVALQTDGKIVVVGEANQISANPDLGMVRYNANGSLDTGFGTGGVVTTDFVGQQDNIHTVAVLPSGKILAAGTARIDGLSFGIALAQYNSDGSPDTSFGTNGKVTPAPGSQDTVNALVLQPDGKFVVGGGAQSPTDSLTGQNFLLARYNPNGTVDTSFGSFGRSVTNFFGGSSDLVNGLALQADGRIVAVGDYSLNSVHNFVPVARYDTNGVLLGKLRQSVFGGSTTAAAVAVQTDGKIVVAGTSNGGFTVLRYVNITSTVTHAPPGDFDGDGKTDLSVFRPNGGIWYTINSSDGSFHFAFMGTSPIHLVPSDYDGDGKADLAYVSNGSQWSIRGSHGVLLSYSLGTGTDWPIPADYDGDGQTEAADFRPSNALWFNLSENGTGMRTTAWGTSGDIAVPGDYDGDGQTDLAVFRPSNGGWYVLRSSNGSFAGTAWGLSTDHPVPGDYDGDQKTDLAVWRPSTGGWYVLRSSDGTFTGTAFGNESFGDVPVPGDFDGDHKTDIAVWRAGTWYWLLSSDGSFHAQMFGQAGDIPIPATYIP